MAGYGLAFDSRFNNRAVANHETIESPVEQ